MQELEIESEQLDKSFNKYLKKQNEEKRLIDDGIDKVWQQYERTRSDMMKTFVIPKAQRLRKSETTSVQFNGKLTPIIPISTDEPTIEPRITETGQFKNPYKILHSNLVMTGAFNPLTNDKGKSKNAHPVIPTISVQKEVTTSADKISQIPVPMKIASSPKKSNENEAKTVLRISTSKNNVMSLSETRDTSPVSSLKNAASPEVEQSQHSDTSIKSKGSEIVINSPMYVPSDELRNGFGNTLAQHPDIGKVGAVETRETIDELIATNSVTKEHAKEMLSMFQKMDIENASKRSTSSESSIGRKISTGHRSTSSDEFWK